MRTKAHRQTDHRRNLRDAQIERTGQPGLAGVIDRNITTIAEIRERAEAQRSRQDRMADAITRFSGSMSFVYLHAVWFGIWIIVNLPWFGFQQFDPFPFGLLTLIVSLEAIFLSTFVLLSQNRQAAVADRRAELDLQINLLSEYEVTRLLLLVDRIAEKLGVTECCDPELPELEKDVRPDAVLKNIEDRECKAAQKNGHAESKKASRRQTAKKR